MRNVRLGNALQILLVLLVLLASVGLRLWGSGFGLPNYTRYHPDEHALVDRAAQILWTGDWNLHRFNYPAFYAYLQAGAYTAYFLWGATQGRWNEVLPFTLPEYYQAGRALTALIGALTVLAVYLCGRQMSGRRAGLLAAALLGGCYLHIIHSHYATFDVMVAFLVVLAYLFSELLRTRQQARWYFLAGLCAGLAGATKYNGAMAVVMPLVAHILSTPWGEWGWLNSRLLVMCGGFLIGFFGGNPYALGNMPDFLTGLATVLHHYGTEQPGFEGSGNWRWYLSVLFSSADRFLLLGGMAGLVMRLWRDWRQGILLWTFPLLYYAVISGFVVRFERNLVSILPFLALGAALLLDELANWLARWKGGGSHTSSSLAALGTCLFLILPVVAGVRFDMAIAQTDQREIAGAWVEENIAWGSKIAVEHYSIPFDHSDYDVRDVIRISDHDMAWYVENGFDVLIISDGVWEVLRRQPAVYADKVGTYNELTTQGRLLAEFVPDPPSLVVAGYPTVAIYHFAPVRIYETAR